MKIIQLLSVILLLSQCQPKQGNFEATQIKTIENDTMNYFPFTIYTVEGSFVIHASLESEDLYPKYYDFFAKHQYEGNGDCWVGHVTQILEKLDKELLNHLDFDPEAGGFYAYADNEANQLRFVKVLSPIFSDLAKLEEYVKVADKSRIDD